MDWSLKVARTSDVDSSGRDKWTATKQPERIGHFVKTLQAGGRLKPCILARTPDDVLNLVDGHHRFLAAEAVDAPIVCYVCDVPTWQKGDAWYDMHSKQKTGPSRDETEEDDSLDGLSPEQVAWVKKDPKNKDRADNPASWVVDEDTWEAAKAAVMPRWDEYEQPCAVVVHVYRAMGGASK